MNNMVPLDWLRGKESTPEAQAQIYARLYNLAEWAYGWICNFPSRTPEEEESRKGIARELGDFLHHPTARPQNDRP